MWEYLFLDQRVKDLFLMRTPFPGLVIIGLYMAFILKWGPKYMENRRPMKVEGFIKVFNIIQIFCCTFLFFECIRLYYLKGFNIVCEPIDFSDTPHLRELSTRYHMFFLLKLLDFGDTIFFVLRKKQNQVTFLHVYHHVGAALMAWGGVKWYAGGSSLFFGFINCFIHIFMYLYYYLTLSDKKNIWWKKYLTQIQIVGFDHLTKKLFL